MKVRLRRFRWYGLFLWVMLASAALLVVWLLGAGDGWLLAILAQQLGLWLWLANRASASVGAFYFSIRAGFSALDVPLHRIDADSIRLLDDDLELQQKLEARPALHFGDHKYGWFSPATQPLVRFFLASNGRNVLAFSYGQGASQVRVSIEDATARAQLIEALKRGVAR